MLFVWRSRGNSELSSSPLQLVFALFFFFSQGRNGEWRFLRGIMGGCQEGERILWKTAPLLKQSRAFELVEHSFPRNKDISLILSVCVLSSSQFFRAFLLQFSCAISVFCAGFVLFILFPYFLGPEAGAFPTNLFFSWLTQVVKLVQLMMVWFCLCRVVYMNTGYGTELIGHTHL